MTTTDTLGETMAGRVRAAGGAAEETMRQARRAVVRGRYAVEDAAAAATLRIRRRPLGTAGVIALTAAAAGILIGFAVSRCARRRTSDAAAWR